MFPAEPLEPMVYELSPSVKRPARYLGCELHAARSPQPGDLRVGLAFPDLYEVGMSHLGLNLLYSCVNQTPGLFSERVFMPDDDLERILRERKVPLTTLETKTPLHHLDVLGFSLAYELTYTNVLGILDLGSIPLRSEERSRQHPIVIAGGPCAFNPEPLAPFIDAFVVGEAEFRLVELCRIVKEWKASRSSRQELLRTLDRIESVYVPSLFEWKRRGDDGRERLVPLSGRRSAVRKCEVPSLDEAPYPQSPIVPFARIVHDRIGIEAARGCPHACRFCQAGNLYRPYRERSPERVREIVFRSLQRTGYEQVSLLALSIGDYSCLGTLVGSLMEELEPKRISLSLPSLRVGSLEPYVVEQILRVRKTGFTLAPEAATPRLRGVVNKRISEEELMRTAHLIARLGWRSLKLYFMLGLPTETEEEVEEIARMAQRIRRNARAARNGSFHLTVNVSSFVPKAHTPLQWMKQQALEDTEQKQRFLQGKLSQPAFRLKWHDARLSLLEGLFARGDRKLADLLEAAYRLGCRRDGWSEHLRFDLWQKAFEQTGINPDDRLDPYPDPNDPLPWDWIDTGMPREWFRAEHRKAMAGEHSEFACSGRCEECGLCAKAPARAGEWNGPARDSGQARASAKPLGESSPRRTGNPAASRYRLQYVKRRPASYLSHLETLTVFHRALRRSQLPIHYTGGEHPHPKVAFSQALPLGVESRAEYMDLWLSRVLEGTEIEKGLNAVLPEGIAVVCASPVPLNAASLEQSIVWMEYEISFPKDAGGSPSQEELEKAIETFRAGKSTEEGSRGEAGRNDEDLRRAVRLAVKEDGTGLVCRVHRLPDSTPSAVRVVESLFPSPDRNGVKPRILKTEAALLGPYPPRPVSKRKPDDDK